MIVGRDRDPIRARGDGPLPADSQRLGHDDTLFWIRAGDLIAVRQERTGAGIKDRRRRRRERMRTLAPDLPLREHVTAGATA